MCGIAGVYRFGSRGFDKLDSFAAELLAGIAHRGSDATGYVAVDDAGSVQLQKASCSAFYFNQHRGVIAANSRVVLLHTRFATQGKPAFPENNHPVTSKGLYAVHNGHISNDALLFETLGGPRAGAVDSEAIPAWLGSLGWGSITAEDFSAFEGDMAVAVVNPSAPKELILARGNGSPLVYLRTDTFLVWASEYGAIREAWKNTLGTPPSAGKFKNMTEGSAMFVTPTGIRTEYFKPPTPWYRLPRAVTPLAPAKYVSGAWRPAWDIQASRPDRAADVDFESSKVVGYQWEGRCEDCGTWDDELELMPMSDGQVMELCTMCAGFARQVGNVMGWSDDGATLRMLAPGYEFEEGSQTEFVRGEIIG